MDAFSARPATLKLKNLDDPVHLYIIQDVHLGERGCREDFLAEVVAEIAQDRRAVWYGNGDYGAYMAPDDKRFRADEVSERFAIADLARWGDTLTEAFVDAVAPIRDKCLGLGSGNHEDVYGKRNNCNPTYDIAAGLHVPHTDYVTAFDLRMVPRTGKPKTLSVLAHHGFGSAVTPQGKLAALGKLAGLTTARLCLMGHSHGRADYEFCRVENQNGKIRHVPQYAVLGGSVVQTYVRGPSNYAQRRAMPPFRPGVAKILIHPRTLEMTTEWLMASGV